jgi:hypothetical protein
MKLSAIALETLASDGATGLSGDGVFGLALRNFLDWFYAACPEDRAEALAEEPPRLRAALEDGRVADAYPAAFRERDLFISADALTRA